MAVPSLDEFVNEVKQKMENNQIGRLWDILKKIPIEDQVSFLLASLDEIVKNSTLDYDAVKEILKLYKIHLQSMTKSALVYMPLNSKLNWIAAKTVRNFLPPESKLPYNKIVPEDIKQFKTLYQQLNSEAIDPTDPPSLQYIKKYLATEPFAIAVVSALGDHDMEQVQYLLYKIPLEDIELYIKGLVNLAIKNKRYEKEFANLLSNFLNTVRMQPGHANIVYEVVEDLARNLEVKDPTSIVNPNLQRLVRHVSLKQKQKRFSNEQTKRNAPYQKLKNNTIARLKKQKSPQWIIDQYMKAPMSYYKSGWAGSPNTRRSRRRRT